MEQSQGTKDGDRESRRAWDEATGRVSEAQAALAGKALAPTDRESHMYGLIQGLEQLNGLFDRISAADMANGLAGAGAIVQGERQLQAIREQTATMNAGQFAMWRQTMEGRTYLAWEEAAAALLRTVQDRDDLTAAAIRADLDSDRYRAPAEPRLVPVPTEQAKPKIDDYQYSDPPDFLSLLFGLSIIWLLVEVVIGLFGAEGLLNNWVVLAIVIGLAIVGNLFAQTRVRPQYEADKKKWDDYLDAWASAEQANEEMRSRHQGQRDEWVYKVQAGLGVSPLAPELDWVADPSDRKTLEHVRQTLQFGRTTFPGPETLPALALPRAKAYAGNDPGTQLNQLLRGFGVAIEGTRG